MDARTEWVKYKFKMTLYIKDAGLNGEITEKYGQYKFELTL